MNSKFLIGLTTDPQDGMFLLVGQEVDHNYTAVFLLPEKEIERVPWGICVNLDMRGPTINIEGDFYPCATVISVDQDRIAKSRAVELIGAMNEFLEAKGWVEHSSERRLEDVLQEMGAYLNVFPD